jgi:hypothetical protein
MMRKRGLAEFGMSEPQFLISVMDRHNDWAVIVCLIGGGQEINSGEAGIEEWFAAIRSSFPDWKVYVSDRLTGSEYLGDQDLKDLMPAAQVTVENDLHLAVSIRSFRSERVAELVKSLLDDERQAGQALVRSVDDSYPIVLTRRLQVAKDWLRAKARGSERFGLLASSGALRLRAIGLDVRADPDVINWHLAGKDDVRSSYYMESAATEFHVQGLEVDWACVVWDADLRYCKGWEHFDFKGTRWSRVHDPSRQRYLTNAYRVLLTRARQGMVIVVPEGDTSDHTRPTEFYDGTYAYLRGLGIQEIDGNTTAQREISSSC